MDEFTDLCAHTTPEVRHGEVFAGHKINKAPSRQHVFPDETCSADMII